MKILVAANHVPFVRGGAEYHIEGLGRALIEAGHQVDVLRLPFRFQPEYAVEEAMTYAESLDMRRPNGVEIDCVISLQFPAWGIRHPDNRVWVMHQHRIAYELYDPVTSGPEMSALKPRIASFDARTLGRATRLFANSARVAERLHQYNQLDAQPLHHPPPFAEHFYCDTAQPYVFYPSRMEGLKRQMLLVEAARFMHSPLAILLAGEGGQQQKIAQYIEQHGLQHRVKMLGRISEAEKIAFYAHSQAVCFIPFDEDYGYITLEAMLSSKPVVTCNDSGGPLAFVKHDHTGWVETADPRQLAERLDWIHAHPAEVARVGQAARAHYESAGIGWQKVVAALIE